VTNTIPLPTEKRKCKKIRTLSVGKLLAQAVEAIHDETSVSGLFI
jgi:ribose-phosphate pyrophosphokinase